MMQLVRVLVDAVLFRFNTFFFLRFRLTPNSVFLAESAVWPHMWYFLLSSVITDTRALLKKKGDNFYHTIG